MGKNNISPGSETGCTLKCYVSPVRSVAHIIFLHIFVFAFNPFNLFAYFAFCYWNLLGLDISNLLKLTRIWHKLGKCKSYMFLIGTIRLSRLDMHYDINSHLMKGRVACREAGREVGMQAYFHKDSWTDW